MLRRSHLYACAATLLLSASAYAADMTPAGTWKTIDDKTGQAKSIIEIAEQNGELTGKVKQVLQSDQGPNPICKDCEGERKDQPVTGMTILWGMKKDGAEYGGGRLLDVETGKEVRGKLKLIEGGKKLEVRGYVGLPMAGRTSTWTRE